MKMTPDSRARIIRIAALSFITLGLVLNFLQGNALRMLTYYTILSNVMVWLCLLLVLHKSISQSPRFMIFKLVVTTAVLLTFFVYHLVLYPVISKMDGFDYPWPIDFLVHTFAPLYMLFDFLMFDRTHEIKKIHGWVGVLGPLLYYLFVVVYGACGGRFFGDEQNSRYPYFFLDPEIIGIFGVVLSVMGIALFSAFIGFGTVLVRSLIRNHRPL
jgi:hypothetical protein